MIAQAFVEISPLGPGGERGLRGWVGAGAIWETGSWRVETTFGERDGAGTPWTARFHWPGTAGPGATVGVGWEFAEWSEAVFVLLPAGAYAGNRFRALPLPYSPRLPAAEVGAKIPTIITDVPRLAQTGPSRLELKAGDLAFPLVACFDPRTLRAWAVVAPAHSEVGDINFVVEENASRTRATIRLFTPGQRETATCVAPGFAGGPVWITVREVAWACPDLAAFFDRVFTLRSEAFPASPLPPTLPLSAAADLIEAHYHRDCWDDALGLFATDVRPDSPYYFQSGWCGGMQATYPLLASRRPESVARAIRSWETFLRGAALPSGLFFGKCLADGRWMADFAHDAARPHTHAWHLIRREADVLGFGLRQLALLERLAPAGWSVPAAWWRALERCAEALVGIWDRYGQFGQFVDQHSGDVLVGNSASGGFAPAALVAAWRRFRRPEFLRVAEAAGVAYARDFLARGYTTGGPGDACQNPDSESAAGLVESYAALYAATGGRRWLDYGRQAAALLATWVMPYVFRFPPGTEFARLDIRTRGSVFANTQNKHSAPGLCTHSGIGLLHLFRATGDRRLLDLLAEIARFLPQVVSREDRPIIAKDGRALPSGWMNERVNTSSWDFNLGGVFYGSCWCEVSLWLTALELPGIYARRDIGDVWCLDHVEARWDGDDVVLMNPTAFPARVRVLVEEAFDAARPLDDLWFLDAPVVELAPGAQHRLQPVPLAS